MIERRCEKYVVRKTLLETRCEKDVVRWTLRERRNEKDVVGKDVVGKTVVRKISLMRMFFPILTMLNQILTGHGGSKAFSL